MTEAQGGAVAAFGNGLVGCGNEIAQQGGMPIGHTLVGEWRKTAPKIPSEVVVCPYIIPLFFGEEVVEVHVFKLVMALHIAHQVEQIGHQFLRISNVLLCPFVVGKQSAEQSLGVQVLVLKLLFHLTEFGVENFVGFLVVVVHVVHVVGGGISGDAEPRIECFEGGHGVLHRKNAPYHHSGTRIHACIAGKHFREVLQHACGNALVLFGADVAQFAQSLLRSGFHVLKDG